MRNLWFPVIWRTPRYRSLAGLAVALAILPVLLGVLACLKTPVGDPERGWIDPRLTGIWLSGDPRPSGSEATISIFEPYDARTWLITSVDVGHAGDAAAAVPPPESVDVLHILATLRGHPPGTASVALYKAWLTTLGGQRFLVLEPKAQPTGNTGFRPELWFPYRVQLQGARVLLSFVNVDTEHLDETTSRKKAEQIIARHAAEADFYKQRTELFPVPRAGYDQVAEILKSIGFGCRPFSC